MIRASKVDLRHVNQITEAIFSGPFQGLKIREVLISQMRFMLYDCWRIFNTPKYKIHGKKQNTKLQACFGTDASDRIRHCFKAPEICCEFEE